MSWSVIHDIHRGVVGTADVGATADGAMNYRPTDFKIPWFCQHNTGEESKSEQHLQNREQIMCFLISVLCFSPAEYYYIF